MTIQTATPRYATVPAAAEYAACSAKTLRRRISEGALPAYRVGPRMLRVDLSDVDALFCPVPTATLPAGGDHR